MSLVQCPECSSQVSSSALMCLTCGFPISKSKGLSVAILLKDAEMAADMIQLGADVNALDENGRTPLMNAAAHGSVNIVEILINAGASTEFVNSAGENALSLSTNNLISSALLKSVPEKSETTETVPAETTAAETETIETAPTENAAAETPAAETPAAETPAAETPAAETPAAETPAAETPAAETAPSEIAAAEIAPDETAPAIHVPEEDTQKIIFPIEETQKTEPLRIQLSEDEPEKEIDGSICLQCGGGIKPDDINCPHCQILIMRRYCSHCSKLIPDHSVLCPLCGKDVQEHFHYSKLRRAKVVIGTATGAVVVLLLLLFVWQQSFSQPTPIQESDANSPEITPNVPESREKTNLSRRPESLPQSKNEIRPKPKKRIVTAPAPKPSEESEIIEAAPTEIETGTVEGQGPDPSMPASTQRALELNDQQRILRGRFLNSKGYTLIKAGRPSEAIPLLEQSVRSFPQGTKDVSYAYALFNLGVAWRMVGRPDIAIPILEERLKINNQPEVVQRELMVAKRQARQSGLARNQ